HSCQHHDWRMPRADMTNCTPINVGFRLQSLVFVMTAGIEQRWGRTRRLTWFVTSFIHCFNMRVLSSGSTWETYSLVRP
ncbi:MAG: hypothetical protein ACKOW8_03900, partial [Flavobacteriales bacterium]